jgi:hypothetical protein
MQLVPSSPSVWAAPSWIGSYGLCPPLPFHDSAHRLKEISADTRRNLCALPLGLGIACVRGPFRFSHVQTSTNTYYHRQCMYSK